MIEFILGKLHTENIDIKHKKRGRIMLYQIVKDNCESCDLLKNARLLMFLGIIFSFVATFIATGLLKNKLPRDVGRDFAVDGKKSAGKGRGAGVIFVPAFIISVLIFFPLNAELAIYLLILLLTMLSGFLDDAAKTPWGEYKKGIIDFVIALGCAITYVHYNGSKLTIMLIDKSFTLPEWLYVILAIILIWAAINVVNCSDGVDGLSASLVITSLIAFFAFFKLSRPELGSMPADWMDEAYNGNEALKESFLGNLNAGPDFGVLTSGLVYRGLILAFIFCLLAYLWFNANPSILMMGDAGSRAMGMFLAILALKSGCPLLFIPLALVIILDGGLGLIKIVCIRFLKIKGFMKNIRTPLHDHVRKNKEPAYSPTQVVFRFVILHAVICMFYIGLLMILRL